MGAPVEPSPGDRLAGPLDDPADDAPPDLQGAGWPASIGEVLDRFGVTPLQVVLGAVIVAASAATLWALLRTPEAAVEARIPVVTVPPPPPTAPSPVAVHAAGAVVSPGLYQLEPGARVADVIEAAGGVTPQADLDGVNLAAPVEDGWQVYVPVEGEGPPPAMGPQGAFGPAGGPGTPATTLDLNRATADELDELPGIGPTIAAAIVEHRERHGPFRSVDDLLEVPGIGPTRLERLRDLVTVR